MDSSSAVIFGQHPESSSTHSRFTSMDPFSKEVTDHPLEVFLDYNFEVYSFFSRVEFLQQYAQDTANIDQIYAMCSVAAWFSGHPTAAKIPPSSAGDVYVGRVRIRMVHMLFELNRCGPHLGTARQGRLLFRSFFAWISVECMAARMLQELGLHRLYAPYNSFATEIERIAFESKLRTFAFCMVDDVVNSHISGLPLLFEHIMEGSLSPSNALYWWMERIAITNKDMEPVDNSLGILHTVLKPRRIRGGGIVDHTARLFSAVISDRHFVSKVS